MIINNIDKMNVNNNSEKQPRYYTPMNKRNTTNANASAGANANSGLKIDESEFPPLTKSFKPSTSSTNNTILNFLQAAKKPPVEEEVVLLDENATTEEQQDVDANTKTDTETPKKSVFSFSF
jgi:hypothetical protein